MIVVDASVAVKWVRPEIHTDAAEALLTAEERLGAPVISLHSEIRVLGDAAE